MIPSAALRPNNRSVFRFSILAINCEISTTIPDESNVTIPPMQHTFDVELISWETIDARSIVASSSLIFLMQKAATDTQRHASFVA